MSNEMRGGAVEWHPPPLANKFSLSSMLGMADMMYGADAGTGPGV